MNSRRPTICVDLAGIMGDAWRGSKVELVPSGVGYREGRPIFNRLGGLGECRELPYFEGDRSALIFVLI